MSLNKRLINTTGAGGGGGGAQGAYILDGGTSRLATKLEQSGPFLLAPKTIINQSSNAGGQYLFLNSDGTLLYTRSGAATHYKYSLSTPFDVSTSVYLGTESIPVQPAYQTTLTDDQTQFFCADDAYYLGIKKYNTGTTPGSPLTTLNNLTQVQSVQIGGSDTPFGQAYFGAFHIIGNGEYFIATGETVLSTVMSYGAKFVLGQLTTPFDLSTAVVHSWFNLPFTPSNYDRFVHIDDSLTYITYYLGNPNANQILGFLLNTPGDLSGGVTQRYSIPISSFNYIQAGPVYFAK
jgi:hypothetical protein